MSHKEVLPRCLGLMLVTLFVAGCGASPAQPTPTLISPTATPTVSLGEIKGQLVSSGGSSVGGRSLGLWKTACGGSGGFQKMEETGLKTKSDESGAFLFEDVPPGCYTMFVEISLQKNPLTTGSGMALIEVLPGETSDLGSIPYVRK